MQYHTKIMPNGMTGIVVSTPDRKGVCIHLLIRVGSRYENSRNNGIAHLLEHMLFRGTEKRPNRWLVLYDIEQYGGKIRASTHIEYTMLNVEISKEHMAEALEVLADLVTSPRFDKTDLETEKNVVLKEIQHYADNPESYLLDHLVRKELYGDHPVGMPVEGVDEIVEEITTDQLFNFWKKHYTATNMAICVVGDVDHIEVLNETFPKIFASVPNGRQEESTPIKEKVQKKPSIVVKQSSNTEQAYCTLFIRTNSVSSSDLIPLMLLRDILCDGIFSRLVFELKERRGIAYDVSGATKHLTDCGFMILSGLFDTEDIVEAVGYMMDSLRDIKENNVKKEGDLDFAKSKFIGALDSWSDDMDYVAHEAVTDWALLDGRIVSVKETQALIQNTTLTDMKRVVDRYFTNERLNLAVLIPDDFLKLTALKRKLTGIVHF